MKLYDDKDDANTNIRMSTIPSSSSIGSRQSTTFIAWSPPVICKRNCYILAMGMSKGAFALYDAQSRQTTSILGKHSDRITCGVWTCDELLILGSNDRTISVSNAGGDTLQMIDLGHVPVQVNKAGSTYGDFSHIKALINVGGRRIASIKQCGENFESIIIPSKLPGILDEEVGDIIACHCIEEVSVYVLAYQRGFIAVLSMEDYGIIWSKKIFQSNCKLMTISSSNNMQLVALGGKFTIISSFV